MRICENYIMVLVFVDETSDQKFKNYFGLCCAIINSAYYSNIKKSFHSILIKGGWDHQVEFKGSILFSAKKGDLKVPIEKRIEIAKKILALNAAERNARWNFHYFRKNSTDHKKDYLTYLPQVLEKALPKPKNKNGKDIVSIHCDHRSDIKIEEIRSVITPTIKKKKFVLFEDVVMPTSRFETVGLLYADLIGYLISRIDTIKNDSDLFENILPEEWETNGKIKKLKSSQKLLQDIKKIKRYEVKPKK